MKYNIPARTLRDWMKRLNIKSVFTHNNHSSSSNATSNDNNDVADSSIVSTTNTPKTSSTKNNLSVTSVQTPESTIAIKDINKLKPTDAIVNTDCVGTIKVEQDENNELETKMKQVLKIGRILLKYLIFTE